MVADRDDEQQHWNVLFALLLNPHRIGRPQWLENPCPSPSLHFTLNQNKKQNSVQLGQGES
jgi:hypothetical protein